MTIRAAGPRKWTVLWQQEENEFSYGSYPSDVYRRWTISGLPYAIVIAMMGCSPSPPILTFLILCLIFWIGRAIFWIGRAIFWIGRAIF